MKILTEIIAGFIVGTGIMFMVIAILYKLSM